MTALVMTHFMMMIVMRMFVTMRKMSDDPPLPKKHTHEIEMLHGECISLSLLDWRSLKDKYEQLI
jgi:hypothetical protein